MAVFIGSGASETITPTLVSGTVIRIPAGSFPSAAGDVIHGLGGNDTLDGGGGGDVLDGGEGDDRLRGNTGDDVLVDDAGNDNLNGGSGADRMAGGIGNDVYAVDNTGDVVTELAGQGTDTVRASISYALANNVENLTLAGSGSINGTGNALNNTLQGNTGNNVLQGEAGADTMEGGAGADNLTGGSNADTFAFQSLADSTVAGTGRDTVADFHHAQSDKIDVSSIDANSTVPGNQAFTFIAAAAFSDSPGELRIQAINGNTLVTGDVNGNGVADFSILVRGVTSLQAGDFHL